MDQNNIERLSTSWINIHFSTDLLDPRLNQQDKGPSWDGEIDCYEQPGKRKKDRVGSCKVQVKGKSVQIEELDKDVISYPVEVDDLRNYGIEGGVIFFVVLIADRNQNSRRGISRAAVRISPLPSAYLKDHIPGTCPQDKNSLSETSKVPFPQLILNSRRGIPMLCQNSLCRGYMHIRSCQVLRPR